MKYGLANIFIEQPLSLILSILLLLGVSKLGIAFQRFIKKKYYIKYITNNFFSPIIGTYVLIFFLYPLTMFNLLDYLFIKIISSILLFLGFLFFFELINKFSKDLFLKLEMKFFLIMISFFLLFLIAAAPITHADSLSYHLTTASYILFNGGFNPEIIPFEDKIAGGGEIIIALGLSYGLQQFGTLIQFSSLLSLIPIFNKNKLNNTNLNYVLILLFTPITLFLISSPKPQLMPAMASLIVFSFLFTDFLKTHQSKNIYNFILICILLINFLVKFNFILSSFILFLILIYENFKIKNLKKFIFLGVCIFTYLIIPNLIFKIINFQTNIIDALFNPLPINIYGYDKLNDVLIGSDISKNFLNLIFPQNFGQISTIFGPGILLFFFINIKKIKLKESIYISAIIIFLIIQYFYGSSLNRFYFETYTWMFFLLSVIGIRFKYLFKIFKKYFYLQNFIIFCGCIYLAFQLFPGSLTPNLYKKVMHENANSYSLINWANKYIEDNDKVISYSRSISLYNVYSIFSDVTWYVDFKDKKSDQYLNFIKSKKINVLVFGGEKLELGIFKNCIGEQIAFKEKVGRHVGRNPFNKGNFYNGWIFKFNYKDLSDCIIR